MKSFFLVSGTICFDILCRSRKKKKTLLESLGQALFVEQNELGLWESIRRESKGKRDIAPVMEREREKRVL
jgi:hypothetical protein